METRLVKVIAGTAGGTAGKNAKTYKVSLPSAWVAALGLSGSERRIELSFDGRSVTIRPVQSLAEFRANCLSQNHELLEIRFYDGDKLCTLIYADRTARDLRAEDYTDNPVKTAFGGMALPSWADLEEFLEERCVPRERDGLRYYLEELGLDEYDPLSIVRKTKGRMAEDDQWLEVEMIT